jgi:mRNA interferase RelE/StbE
LAFEIVYKASVHRDLKGLPKAEAARILERIESELAAKPEANPILHGRFSGMRRLRVGDYRIVYTIMKSEVLVLRIGHRQDVYKGGIREDRKEAGRGSAARR